MPKSKGHKNVFAALESDAVEAANLHIRAQLMIDIKQHIEKEGWTQVEAAKVFGVTQPRISSLINGNIDRFSIDMLANMLAAVGRPVSVKVPKAQKRVA